MVAIPSRIGKTGEQIWRKITHSDFSLEEDDFFACYNCAYHFYMPTTVPVFGIWISKNVLSKS